jgi:hypothetical protein
METSVYDTPREKLQGAFKLAMQQQIEEVNRDLGLLINAQNGLRKRLGTLRSELCWIEHGVRPGSIVEWNGPSTRRMAPKKNVGRVIEVEGDSYSGKPTPKVVQQLKDGTWGTSPHTLYSYHDWKVVTP